MTWYVAIKKNKAVYHHCMYWISGVLIASICRLNGCKENTFSLSANMTAFLTVMNQLMVELGGCRSGLQDAFSLPLTMNDEFKQSRMGLLFTSYLLHILGMAKTRGSSQQRKMLFFFVATQHNVQVYPQSPDNYN